MLCRAIGTLASASIPACRHGHARLICTTSVLRTSSTLPLVQLQNAILPDLHSDTSTLSIEIPDAHDQLWAIVAPPTSSGAGAKVLAALTTTLSGQRRPQQRQAGNQTRIHPSVHPFSAHDATRIGLASFSKQQHASNSGSGNEFQDFSKRYGALREEDFVTLYERIMFDQGFEVGRVAKLRIVPDRLIEDPDADTRRRAGETKQHIEHLAPMLGLLKPVPGTGPSGPPLLHQPLISLSNGQTRRASICGALVSLARDGANASEETTTLLVLVQPYSGLDEPSRNELSDVLAKLHGKGTPRVILILRRQDELPAGVTHVIDIDAEGRVWTGRREDWHGSHANRPKGVEGIRENHEQGVGVGFGEDVAELQGISVCYGETTVLDRIHLHVKQGSRLVIKGANGSGKTTLLALLNGSHPQSYSFDEQVYKLFGQPRSAVANATRLLNRRIGYFGPDLLAAFPRRGVETGGLTVGQAIASGFEGIYSRISTTPAQRSRIRSLFAKFSDCLGFRDDRIAASVVDRDPETLLHLPFISLNSGSQGLTLFLRAIINQPDLLILDEPFQGMDAEQIARIRRYIDTSTRLEDAGIHGDEFAVGETEEERIADAEKRQRAAVILVSHFVNEWPDRMGEFLLLDEGRAIDRI